MRQSHVGFSAQFGGRDAADAVKPHFFALKSAAAELPILGFPVPELAYILRVDGEVSTFEDAPGSTIEIDRNGKYIALDIVISLEDRHRLEDVFCHAILSSVDILNGKNLGLDRRINPELLRASLLELTERYRKEVQQRRHSSES